ncbi:MAG: hypothetical protein ACK49J_05005, partial [Verrucomicrobiota bacterium]
MNPGATTSPLRCHLSLAQYAWIFYRHSHDRVGETSRVWANHWAQMISYLPNGAGWMVTMLGLGGILGIL